MYLKKSKLNEQFFQELKKGALFSAKHDAVFPAKNDVIDESRNNNVQQENEKYMSVNIFTRRT